MAIGGADVKICSRLCPRRTVVRAIILISAHSNGLRVVGRTIDDGKGLQREERADPICRVFHIRDGFGKTLRMGSARDSRNARF